MNVYGIDEYTKYDYEDLMYDRVIVFTLLRSNVYVCLKDGKFEVTQQPHVLDYATDSIKNIETEELRAEKSKIEYWTKVHINELNSGLCVEDIVKNFTNDYNDSLTLNNIKPVVIRMEYASKKVLKEQNAEKDEVIKALNKVGIASTDHDHYLSMLGTNWNQYSRETIRFYVIKDTGDSVATVDICLTSNIVEVTSSAREVDYESLKYFCNKYFELLKSKTPLEDIAALDNGNIIDYSPSMSKRYK